MTPLRAEEPPVARLIKERDGKASVEVDGPFNAAARRGGANYHANYTLHLEVPHANPILAQRLCFNVKTVNPELSKVLKRRGRGVKTL